ncbi:MAG: hypothetical protein U9M89_01095 [Patescibacteria group bacterium]|nr:hypothetical protein [Patescibacteria group bacterium]
MLDKTIKATGKTCVILFVILGIVLVVGAIGSLVYIIFCIWGVAQAAFLATVWLYIAKIGGTILLLTIGIGGIVGTVLTEFKRFRKPAKETKAKTSNCSL